ncbi:TetR/AcrR family transcriptional regulator [Nocardia sp. NPDC049220]|uniref:TetR/AcrR family transcriptional regulator n=1 Tax=Nocardia sp. NPDC049220 TaxID=3155273 RepID=UPI0033EF1D4B
MNVPVRTVAMPLPRATPPGVRAVPTGDPMATVPPMLQRILEKPVTDGEKLLESALSAFLDFGIKRTSMGEIARRAGISPATLYRRYESKNDLVEAVSVREAQRFVAAIDKQVRTVSDSDDQLVEIFVAFISAIARNELLRRLLRTEPDLILPRLTTDAGPILAVGRGYLAEKLRELRETGGTHEFDADLVAEIMARLALSLALTPDGLIPVNDHDAAREFARRTLLPMVGLRVRA